MKRIICLALALPLTLTLGCEERGVQRIDTCEKTKQLVSYWLGKEATPPIRDVGGYFTLNTLKNVRELWREYCKGETLNEVALIEKLNKDASTEAKERWNCLKELKAYNERSYYHPGCINGYRGDRMSWFFNIIKEDAKKIDEFLKERYGVDTGLMYAGVGDKEINEEHKLHIKALREPILNELKRYPIYPLPDSPHKLVAMIEEAGGVVKEEIFGYAMQAYSRMAERILQELRAWQWTYPSTLDRITTLRGYLKDGELELKNIGTSEKEINYLTRRLPSLK